MRFFGVLFLCLLMGCHHQARVPLSVSRCDTVNLTREEVATIRLGQEQARVDLARLRADLDACSKARLLEQERERRLRMELAKARDHTPWIVVVTVVAVAGIAGVVSVALAK